MFLLITVLNDEELVTDLITSWLDIGISGATVIETTGSLQLISRHVPIFAGFRSLTSGGIHHNKTLFTAIEDQTLLDKAIKVLENLCLETDKPRQGLYFVSPLVRFGRLGKKVDAAQNKKHIEAVIGRPLKDKVIKDAG